MNDLFKINIDTNYIGKHFLSPKRGVDPGLNPVTAIRQKRYLTKC